MPNRILREGILTSPRMVKLTWASEVFYRRLHSVVDDFGRYHGDPMLLRAACYPRQLDKVSDSDIGKWIRETVEAGLVRVYEVDGQQHLELIDFRQQVRATKSKFPDPPAGATHDNSKCVADAQHPHTKTDAYSKTYSNTETEAKDKAAPRKRGRSPKTAIPVDFSISERVRQWAAEKGFSQLELHFESFVGKAKSKGYVYADWDEGFMGAVRDDWAELRKAARPSKQQSLEERNARVAAEWVAKQDALEAQNSRVAADWAAKHGDWKPQDETH